MLDIKKIADEADIIVNGYAFTKSPLGFRVLNLNKPERAALFSYKDEVLETTMDDIEIRIVSDYLIQNKKYMEE